MFGLGMSEIIVLGIMALIIIGPKELPELARTLGRFINEMKRSTSVLGEELKQQARIDLDQTIPNPNKQNPPKENQAPEQLELLNQDTAEKVAEEHKQK